MTARRRSSFAVASVGIAVAACSGGSGTVSTGTTAPTSTVSTSAVPISTVAPTTVAGPTSAPAPVTGPMCPPTPGGRIAFERGVQGAGEEGADVWTVHVIHPDGTAEGVLISGQYDEIGEPAWSPDGMRAVLSGVARGEGGHQLVVVRCDGSVEVTMDDLDMETASYPLPIDEASYPTWSPDGATIAFTSVDGIFLVDPGAAQPTRQLDLPVTVTRGRASWSPDGTRLVFGATDGSDNTDIYVVDAHGGGLARLTTDPAEDYQPAWSPDGGTIAFRSSRDEQVWLMAADGDDQRSFTTGAVAAYQPAWSPDGTHLAYVAGEAGDTRVRVVSLDGTGDHQLTQDDPSPRVEGWPDWSGA